MRMPFEADLEAMLGDAFDDGPLQFGGSSTGCILKTSDLDQNVGLRDLADRVIECYYASAALQQTPTSGALVTVAGQSYRVKHTPVDKGAGMTCLYLVVAP